MRLAAKQLTETRCMNAERVTLDTNILVYALDRDAGQRHAQAVELFDTVAERDCVLTLQALAEFFAAVTRKGKVPVTDAAAQVADWQALFPTISAGPSSLNKAMRAVEHHHLSFWDALLWATAREAAIDVLYSEDFQHGRVLEGVQFWNPFASRNQR